MVSPWVAEEKLCEELNGGKCLAPGETDHQHGCDKHIKAQKQEMYFRIYGKKSDQCCNYKEKQQNERNQISSSKK